jgi:hypothetical protein
MHFKVLVCLITFPFAFLFGEDVRLQYLPNISLKHVSEITGQFEINVDTFKDTTSFQQTLTGAVSIDSDETDAIEAPPLDLIYVFTGFQAEVGNDAGSFKVNTRFPEDNIAAEALSKMINHPIQLHFGPDFQLEKGTRELQVLERKMGVFEDFNYGDVLEDLFQEFFLLANKNLKVGFTLSPEGSDGIVVKVVSITDDEVMADIHGEIIPRKNEWSENDVQVIMEVKGKIDGQIAWKRSNALEYRSITTSDFVSTLKMDEIEGSINTHFVHKAFTHR